MKRAKKSRIFKFDEPGLVLLLSRFFVHGFIVRAIEDAGGDGGAVPMRDRPEAEQNAWIMDTLERINAMKTDKRSGLIRPSTLPSNDAKGPA